MSPRIGVKLGSCEKPPFDLGAPLEGFDPYSVTEEEGNSEKARALASQLRGTNGQSVRGILGHLPTGELAAIAMDGKSFIYVIHVPGYTHSDRRVSAGGSICVVNDAPPFEPEEAKRILDMLLTGIPWDDVIEAHEEKAQRLPRLKEAISSLCPPPPQTQRKITAVNASNSSCEISPSLIVTPVDPEVILLHRLGATTDRLPNKEVSRG